MKARPALAPAFLLALACAACTHAPEPPRPRLVVLYATCSLDKRFLEPYDARVLYTPALAALAKESVVFERHVTEAPVSGIAYASLFTGAQADVHGIYHHPSRLPERVLTIFEAFAAAGYETHYFNDHRMASAELGYAQGVAPEHVHASDANRRLLSSEDPDFRALLARLKADPTLHALVVVNFSVTHAAYTAQLPEYEFDFFRQLHPEAAQGVTAEDFRRLGPLYEENRLGLQWDYPDTVQRMGLSPADQERLARLLEAVYAADVTILDSIVGRALETLRASGLDAETLFAFTADHGEYLFHRERLFQWGHGLQLAPEELSVPWLLRPARGAFPPGRFSATTRSIDVFPTLAGLCGVKLAQDAPVEGQDLSPALLGRAAAPALLAPSHSQVLDARLMEEFADKALVRRYFPGEDPSWMWVGVRQQDRFVRWCNQGDGSFAFESFDLAQDPLALHPLEGNGDEDLRGYLRDYKELLIEHYSAERGVDADVIERDLRALGYVR